MEMDDRPFYTVKEYFDLEEHSNLKHEYYAGQIWAMGGGTLDHSRIAMEIGFHVRRQLEGRPCAVYTSDGRVKTASGLHTYPDITVGCGSVATDAEDPNAQINPSVIVEVTSPSSERYDRGAKLRHYQTIETLQEVVIVSHRERAIDVFRRGEDGTWSRAEHADAGQRVTLTSIGCELDVDAIYRDPRAPVS
jgi:Uma2 family endonuclease